MCQRQRLIARAALGRERNGGFRVRNGNKQTFVDGELPTAAVDPKWKLALVASHQKRTVSRIFWTWLLKRARRAEPRLVTTAASIYRSCRRSGGRKLSSTSPAQSTSPSSA